MELVLEYAACAMTALPAREPASDMAPTMPVLLGQIAELESEAAYLRTMVCELLRKNEKLREQARGAFGEMPYVGGIGFGVKPEIWA